MRAIIWQMVVVIALFAGAIQAPAGQPFTIVTLGDSLTAGYGLPRDQAFDIKLAAALAKRGLNVKIANAGVSGDTANQGLARLAWSVPDGTRLVIIELGANDALRGIDPQVTSKALARIIIRLKKRHIAVLLAGMRAPPNMGSGYTSRFDAIYPALAARFKVPLYGFFLDGVAGHPDLNQRDGLHPTAAGVDIIVRNILDHVVKIVQSAGKS